MAEFHNRITLRISGLDEDGGDVRLNDFVQQLEILKKTLLETQKLFQGENFAYFKIVEMQKNSPAQIVLEAVPVKIEEEHKTRTLVDKFFNSITEIDNGNYPDGFTFETFNAYKDLTSLREKHRLAEVAVSRNGDEPSRLHNFSSKIEKIMGADEYEFGTYSGMLEAINIHHQYIFYIYPTSHLPKLKCSFPKSLTKEAISAVGKYVTVSGEKCLKPNIGSDIPYEMHAQEIEVHRSEDELPTLQELTGIARNITSGKSSEDFVRGIRDEW